MQKIDSELIKPLDVARSASLEIPTVKYVAQWVGSRNQVYTAFTGVCATINDTQGYWPRMLIEVYV